MILTEHLKHLEKSEAYFQLCEDCICLLFVSICKKTHNKHKCKKISATEVVSKLYPGISRSSACWLTGWLLIADRTESVDGEASTQHSRGGDEIVRKNQRVKRTAIRTQDVELIQKTRADRTIPNTTEKRKPRPPGNQMPNRMLCQADRSGADPKMWLDNPLFPRPNTPKPDGMIQESSQGGRQGSVCGKVCPTRSDKTGRWETRWIQEDRSGDRTGQACEMREAGQVIWAGRAGKTNGENARQNKFK